MPSLIEAKKQIRQSIKAQISRLSEDERTKLSTNLMLQVEQHPRFVKSQTILLFYSLPDEPLTHRFISSWAERKQILLPVVTSDEDMAVRRFQSNDMLTEGRFKIEEPDGVDFTDYASIDLVIVPGIAFDPKGHRLGRGRGYYDRFFSHPELQHIYKIGICYPCQFLNAVPAENHDIRMDEVLIAK